MGYTGVIMLLLQVPFLRQFWSAIQKAGRMALSIYLMQTIICTTYFAGFAMGYFGRLPQYQLYIFALQVIVVQVAFAITWFRHYRYGPAEWLLRSLMEKKLLPNKKHRDEPIPALTVIS